MAPLPRLHTVPLDLREANTLITRWHRHHAPAVGHRFSIGVVDDQGTLRGACIVGRPVARAVDHHAVVEVVRLVSDGTKNACSHLYGAAARAAQAMGYQRIQTYILADEPGTSLKAAGWHRDGEVRGRAWAHTDGRPRRLDQPLGAKQRWVRDLNPAPPGFKREATLAAWAK